MIVRLVGLSKLSLGVSPCDGLGKCPGCTVPLALWLLEMRWTPGPSRPSKDKQVKLWVGCKDAPIKFYTAGSDTDHQWVLITVDHWCQSHGLVVLNVTGEN